MRVTTRNQIRFKDRGKRRQIPAGETVDLPKGLAEEFIRRGAVTAVNAGPAPRPSDDESGGEGADQENPGA
ncbi:hypothetical protein [Sediminicurvatus halobius]|uniref:Uncharacterized protein n=1 Tax=Sediminicurvatus halobius TaxID=2182432 RepID=A0A2U2MYG4_9GAMM|nr:hypothetical protein [Spiribacter halobius]PWG61769.1 hypothetical protein DEM34_14990 [Spiribacter halobius]UEX76797.1 hypothetical protein LMH63_12615 [Spiribacter halobius]